VDWFNNRRLLQPIGNIPPAEAEERYYAMRSNPPWRRDSNETASGKPGAVHPVAIRLLIKQQNQREETRSWRHAQPLGRNLGLSPAQK
jgi:hypothetical protein